jgi:hypothetical protein
MSNNCPFDITPYAQSQQINKPNIFNLNYTNQDFWSMKTRLVDFIRQEYGDQFNDFIESSLAIMLVENWAFLADTLSFKMDQIANEIFIDTVTEIENAFRISKLVGFKPQPPIASRCYFTATINNTLNFDLEIPFGYGIDTTSGDSSIRFELFPADSDGNPILEQDIVIPAGSFVNANVIGLEGRSRNELIDSSGEVSQAISLAYSPVIYDSIRVDVDGVRWDQVEYFTDSQRRREYRVEFDSSYNATIVFGNNRGGFIPTQGSRITISYRTGGGVVGNIVAGSISTQGVIDPNNYDLTVPVSFNNYTKGEFGYNGDTIEDIRRKLPQYLRTQNRAVTGLDYKVLAEQFVSPYQGQIGKATAVLRNYGCAANIIDLYILARSGDFSLENASDQLKSELNSYMDEIKMLTDHVCIKDGTILSIDVNIDVFIDRFYKKFEEEIKEKISRRINNFFLLVNWDYGKVLREMDLMKALSDISDPKRYEVSFTTNDGSTNVVAPKFNEIIRPSSIYVNFQYENNL